MIATLITSSALVAAILLLRPLLKKRVSPTLVYSLWALAAVRMTAPWIYPFVELFGLLKSRLSVMNAVDLFQREVIEGSVMEPLADNLATGRVYRYDQPVHIAERAAGIDWQLWIMVVWILGSLLIAAWMIVVNIRFMKMLQAVRRPYTGKLPEFVTKRVYVAENLSSPCYFGIGSDEAIYLPEAIEGDETMVRHALAHETCHAVHGDRFWGIWRCVLVCYYWINPFVWLGAVLSRRDCELACDEAAVKLLGESERYAYGRTLVGLLGERGKTGFFLASTTMTAGKRTMKNRIQTLTHHPKTTFSMAVLLSGIVILLAACTFTQKAGSDTNFGADSDANSNVNANVQEEVSDMAGEHLQTGAAVEAGNDVLVLAADNQQGNFCDIVLERRDRHSGEVKRMFSDDHREENAVTVTSYKDTEGKELSGDGFPDRGFGGAIVSSEGKGMSLHVWNKERAGSFKITVTDHDTILEYLYIPKNVEPISEYTLTGNVRNIYGPQDTLVRLKSVEEFPNALGIVLRGRTQEEMSEFFDGNEILLKPIGAEKREDYIVPREFVRDGMDIYLLYLFPGDIPPLSQTEAFAVGQGMDMEDYVETVLDECQISVTARQFVTAYMSGDEETAAQYSDIPGGELLSEVREGTPGTGTLTTRWNPAEKETYAEGTYIFYEEGQEDSLTYLYLTMKRVLGEWIVVDAWLEK